ncbi:MAG: flagellin [Vampirovibrionales bacterium]|nr:flagellin [Vampirovibrionales bacterium]
MPIVVNTNVASLNAQRQLTNNTSGLNKSLEKLASGYRINRASDDAAGLQISENLRSQIRGSKKALDNVQDGINVMNIMDGTMSSITNNLQRMRELTVQASNDTNSSTQRTAIEGELDELANELTRLTDSTQFNGVDLFNSSMSGFKIHVGPNNSSTNDVIDLDTGNVFDDIGAANLQVDDANLVVDTNANALATLGKIDEALTTVNNRRATLGAMTNRLEGSASNLMVSVENLSASESRIRNVDVASESAEMIRNQILQQASSTVLGQANQGPQLALSLLRG